MSVQRSDALFQNPLKRADFDISFAKAATPLQKSAGCNRCFWRYSASVGDGRCGIVLQAVTTMISPR